MNPIVVSRCVIPSFEQGRLSVLMAQRSMSCNHNPGLLELPGGAIDTEESISDAAAREVAEETGLVAEQLSDPVLAEARRIYDGKHQGRQYLAYGTVVLRFSGRPRPSAEHSRLAIVDYETALDNPMVTNGSKKILTALADTAFQVPPNVQGVSFLSTIR